MSVNPDELEVAPGFLHLQLEGLIPALASADEVRHALEDAFSYRGDVTITRKDGAVVEGYIFDRRPGATLEQSVVRVIVKSSGQKIAIQYSDIAGLAFSGRDTAAGKGWEAWVKRYFERKAAGEKNIRLDPEMLE